MRGRQGGWGFGDGCCTRPYKPHCGEGHVGVRRVVAMGLAGLLASLGGCHQKSQQQAAGEVAAKETPPPKPPNCPDLPELANLRLKDGSIADVRIFRDGDETFYVPFSWYQYISSIYYLGQKPYNSEPGIYSPDVNEVECPGVVHVGEFGYTTPKIPLTKRFGEEGKVPPNFSNESEIDQITIFHYNFSKPRDYPFRLKGEYMKPLASSGEAIEHSAFAATGWITVSKNHVIRFEKFPYDDEYKKYDSAGGPSWEDFVVRAMASERWASWRDSARDLYSWLKMPPKDRNNERIFKLGGK